MDEKLYIYETIKQRETTSLKINCFPIIFDTSSMVEKYKDLHDDYVYCV